MGECISQSDQSRNDIGTRSSKNSPPKENQFKNICCVQVPVKASASVISLSFFQKKGATNEANGNDTNDDDRGVEIHDELYISLTKSG